MNEVVDRLSYIAERYSQGEKKVTRLVSEANKRLADQEAKEHNEDNCDHETCVFCFVSNYLDKHLPAATIA
jgi:hypothetical protein